MSDRETEVYCIALVLVYTTAAGDSTSECECEQEMATVRQELAAVKAEMEGKVDQLQSQLQFWQNVTLNILKDHCSPLSTGKHRTTSAKSVYIIITYAKIFKGLASQCSTAEVKADTLECTLFNITESSKFCVPLC